MSDSSKGPPAADNVSSVPLREFPLEHPSLHDPFGCVLTSLLGDDASGFSQPGPRSPRLAVTGAEVDNDWSTRGLPMNPIQGPPRLTPACPVGPVLSRRLQAVISGLYMYEDPTRVTGCPNGGVRQEPDGRS